MHSMLKRKKKSPNRNDSTTFHIHTSQIQFNISQIKTSFSSLHFEKVKQSQKNPSQQTLKIYKNPSLPKLNHSNQRINSQLGNPLELLNIVRLKEKDQIAINKNITSSKINSPEKGHTQTALLHSNQKETNAEESFYFSGRVSRHKNEYKRKPKYNKAYYYFLKNNPSQSSTILKSYNTQRGRNQFKSSHTLLKIGQIHHQKKEEKQNKNNLYIQGKKPKWRIFEYNDTTQRKILNKYC